jgi:hypothetical protein
MTPTLFATFRMDTGSVLCVAASPAPARRGVPVTCTDFGSMEGSVNKVTHNTKQTPTSAAYRPYLCATRKGAETPLGLSLPMVERAWLPPPRALVVSDQDREGVAMKRGHPARGLSVTSVFSREFIELVASSNEKAMTFHAASLGAPRTSWRARRAVTGS